MDTPSYTARFPKGKNVDVFLTVLLQLALSADGKVYGWGYQFYSLLGPGTFLDKSPVLVPFTNGFTDIAGDVDHVVAVNSSGVFAWGDSPSYALGTGTTDPSEVPVPVAYDFSGSGVTMVAAGRDHSLVSNGTVIWAWGGNGLGQLGDGTTQTRPTPVMINMTALYGKTISKIFAFGATSAALTSDGELWAWGNSSYLISGNAVNPTRVANTGYLSTNPLINDFAIGASFAVAIQSTRPDPPQAPPQAPPVSPPLDPPQAPPVASPSNPLVPASSPEATNAPTNAPGGESAPISSIPSTAAPQSANPTATPAKAAAKVPTSHGHKLLTCHAIFAALIIAALCIF